MKADSDADERTIRRATKWGRDQGVLLMTRRGGRLGGGQVVASEWQLTAGHKPQPVTRDRLNSQPDSGAVSTGQRDRLNRSPEHHHQESVVLQESSSSSAGARGLDLLRVVDDSVTEEESAEVLNTLRGQGARDPVAVLRSMDSGNRNYYLGLVRHNADRDRWRREEPRQQQDDPARYDPADVVAGIRKERGWARKREER
jgi:hypothetical protein